ncbi:MAG: TatD family hydrolase [Clostridia bacterium]|nr:TatD family hydrolase [Clostridia bacterium]
MEFSNIKPFSGAKIFDSHAHYDDNRFDGVLDELLPKIHEMGVERIVNCGCDNETNAKCLEIAEKFPFAYSAVGIHSCNYDSGTTIADIREFAKHEKCVAIGEIGLDYYWEPDAKAIQKKLFTEQIELAKELSLPIIVHDREAHGDVLEILKEYKPKGVVHSFSGSVEMAQEILKLGMYLGIGGVITFKNAKKLPDVVKMLPLDRLLLETDAPYLSPVPFRGKTNHSEMIYLTAQKIAAIKETTLDEILEISYNNANNLCGL